MPEKVEFGRIGRFVIIIPMWFNSTLEKPHSDMSLCGSSFIIKCYFLISFAIIAALTDTTAVTAAALLSPLLTSPMLEGILL